MLDKMGVTKPRKVTRQGSRNTCQKDVQTEQSYNHGTQNKDDT